MGWQKLPTYLDLAQIPLKWDGGMCNNCLLSDESSQFANFLNESAITVYTKGETIVKGKSNML